MDEFLGYREEGYKPYLVAIKHVVVEKFAIWAQNSIEAVVPFIGADERLLSVEELPLRGLKTRLISETKGLGTRFRGREDNEGSIELFCEGGIDSVSVR